MNRSAEARRRRAPTAVAASWARRSPRRSSGARELLTISVKADSLRTPPSHEADRRDDESFLQQLTRDWHRAGRHAADVGVVGAGRDEPDQLLLDEDGRHRREVGQVRAAAERIVHREDVVGREGRQLHDRAHCGGHRAEVDRHVRRLRHHLALGIEDSTTEVAPFLDVWGVGRTAECFAHLLGDRGEDGISDRQVGGAQRLEAAHRMWVGHARAKIRLPSSSTSVLQPGATSVVVSSWWITAGPSIWVPGVSCSR